ncbi:glycoside hydrolase family 88 protein [Streptomyces sp. NPDC005202]|uniref:glycoside hydrolase family 88 protein n=1 Tax=Streptomyces sp. NPDC005202 TaxID=3157021 RepID=UPI0033A9C5F6
MQNTDHRVQNDDATGLWYRDKRFLPGGIVSPSGRPVVWSRGNGWVAGGHTKTLKALPPGERHTAEYCRTLTRPVRAAAAVPRKGRRCSVRTASGT